MLKWISRTWKRWAVPVLAVIVTGIFEGLGGSIPSCAADQYDKVTYRDDPATRCTYQIDEPLKDPAAKHALDYISKEIAAAEQNGGADIGEIQLDLDVIVAQLDDAPDRAQVLVRMALARLYALGGHVGKAEEILARLDVSELSCAWAFYRSTAKLIGWRPASSQVFDRKIDDRHAHYHPTFRDEKHLLAAERAPARQPPSVAQPHAETEAVAESQAPPSPSSQPQPVAAPAPKTVARIQMVADHPALPPVPAPASSVCNAGVLDYLLSASGGAASPVGAKVVACLRQRMGEDAVSAPIPAASVGYSKRWPGVSWWVSGTPSERDCMERAVRHCVGGKITVHELSRTKIKAVQKLARIGFRSVIVLGREPSPSRSATLGMTAAARLMGAF